MLKLPIYMDNHATTRVDPRVLDQMIPYFGEEFGNAGSTTHAFGWRAADACNDARSTIARFLSCHSDEIIITSGATEANNLAIKGVARTHTDKGHLVTSAIEHKSVLESCRRLVRDGYKLTVLPVDQHGRVDPEDAAANLGDDTMLVSIMAANNEVGTLQRISEIGALCRARGVLFHTDATQAAGTIPLDVTTLNADLLSLSAHKLYGPKGIGVLYVRNRRPSLRLDRLFDGGAQEHGMRAGTLAVPLVVGLARACELCTKERDREVPHVRYLCENLYQGIRSSVRQIKLNGHPTERLAGNLNISFPDIDPVALMLNLNDVAVSSGSACTSHDMTPSHVLAAMGIPSDLAVATIRFGLGRFTTEEEVDYAISAVARAVARSTRIRSIKVSA